MSTKFNTIVNENVFTNLLIAKTNIEKLLEKGKVSSQMEMMGTKLHDKDKDYIDYNIYGLYHAVCKYIDCYEDKDYEECFYAGQFLKANHEYGLNKEYLFEVMIRNQLPEAYNANISYNEFGNCLNDNGDIMLTNGNTLHVIGKKDAITRGNHFEDEENSTVAQSEWIAMLPSLLLGHYTVVRDQDDFSICCICNDVLTEKMLDHEWNNIKAEGKAMNDINSEVRLNINGYYFEDEEGNIIDELSMNQAYRANQILYINDALLLGCGKLSVLDNYLSNIEKSRHSSYMKK